MAKESTRKNGGRIGGRGEEYNKMKVSDLVHPKPKSARRNATSKKK